MIFPLYNEEVHLIGRPEITGFDDRADRRVAIGREGSWTAWLSRDFVIVEPPSALSASTVSSGRPQPSSGLMAVGSGTV